MRLMSFVRGHTLQGLVNHLYLKNTGKFRSRDPKERMDVIGFAGCEEYYVLKFFRGNRLEGASKNGSKKIGGIGHCGEHWVSDGGGGKSQSERFSR
jgi:hypothetical protein